MAGRKCPQGCRCGRHFRAKTPRDKELALRKRRLELLLFEGDDGVEGNLRNYLTAFDVMIEAWRKDDEQGQDKAKRLMHFFLYGK